MWKLRSPFGFQRVRFGPFFGQFEKKMVMDDVRSLGPGKGYINVMTHKSVSNLRSLGKEMNLGKSQSFTCSVIHLRNYDLCECGQALGSDELCPDPRNQRSFQDMKERTGVDYR